MKNSGHREAVITFFYLEVSIKSNIPAVRQASGSKTGIVWKGFLVKHRLLDAAARWWVAAFFLSEKSHTMVTLLKQVPVPLIPSADDFAEVAAQKAQELQQQMDEELKKAGL